MNIINLLTKLRDENNLSANEAALLADLQERKIYSIHRELRFLLYIGILLVIAGAGLTVRQYFAQLGDLAIVATLSICAVAAWGYCFMKGGAFAKEEVPAPNIAFDFILFFGCAFYSLDVAYIETHFSLLGADWKNHLL